MSKTVYLIRESGGEYEDSWEHIIEGWFDKDAAQQRLDEFNNHKNRLEDYKDFWFELTNNLDEIVHPEYDEFWENWKTGDPIPDEYEDYLWSDSKERFIYWVKKDFNDIYIDKGEELLIELYDYYKNEYHEYDTSYFDIINVEIMDI